MADICHVISDELLLEILWKLPLKSLLRFKLVSKAWHRWICEIVSTTSGLIVQEYQGGLLPTKTWYHGLPSPSLEIQLSCPQLTDTHLHLLDACGGLLLFTGLNLPTFASRLSTYALCNPVTNQWIQLPQAIDRSMPHHVCLGFDPEYSRQHFNVVRFFRRSDDGPEFVLELFSSRTGTWREFRAERPDVRCIATYTFAFIGRAVFVHIIPYRAILKFDMEEESFLDDVELPVSRELTGCGGIWRSEGHLHYTLLHKSTLKIWKLEESIWILLHSCSYISLSKQVCENQTTISGWTCVCRFLPDSKAVIIGTKGMVFSYDFGTRKVHEICKTDAVHCSVFPFSPAAQHF